MFKTRSRHLLQCLFALLLTLTALGAPAATRAADPIILTVNTFDDPTADSCFVGACSLREAILYANTLGSQAVIHLPAGLYMLAITSINEDFGLMGDLDINASMRLVGLGAPGSTIIDGKRNDRVIDIHGPNVQVSIENVTLINGYRSLGGALKCSSAVIDLKGVALEYSIAEQFGGGIFGNECTISMTDTRVAHNYAILGGGGLAAMDGSFIINGSSIADNDANYNGGGGIFAENTTLDITSSEIIDNQVTGGDGGGIRLSSTNSALALKDSLVAGNNSLAIAGGIYAFEGTSLLIRNSTISGNTAGLGSGGVETRIPTTIEYSTIAHNIVTYNTEMFGGAGLVVNYPGQVSVSNSILANNDDQSINALDDCAQNGEGTITSLGYNLVERNDGCVFGGAGHITGQDPLLGALQDNGGPTRTHALLVGSPAIDAGTPALPMFSYDQRGAGFPRVIFGRVDIGAFEYGFAFFLPMIFR